MQRRGGRLVALVVGTSLVAACSGGGGEAEESSEPSSSATSSTSSSGSSAETAAPAVPVMPEEARGDDDAAAVAFVEHWVELVNYAIATGDTEPARSLSPTCSVCDEALSPIDAGDLAQDPWAIANPEAMAPLSEDADRTDRVVSVDVSAGDDTGTFVFGLSRVSDGWRVSWAGGYE